MNRDRAVQAVENIGRWWLNGFACRFGPGDLPRPGTGLYGCRLRVQIQEPESGEWENWSDYVERRKERRG